GGALMGERLDATGWKRGDRLQQFAELGSGAAVEARIGTIGPPRELAKDLLDPLRRELDSLTALVEDHHLVIALLKHEHGHAQVRRGVIEFTWRLLDRVADEDRGIDFFAVVFCSNVSQHARDFGGARVASDSAHLRDELMPVRKPG